MKSIIFISGNVNKYNELKKLLEKPLIYKKVDLEEIQSLQLADIVAHKARSAYDIVKSPVIIEDTSLLIDQLNGLPGPFIKWFIASLGLNGICNIISSSNRRATAISIFAYYDGKDLYTFEGKIRGKIPQQPRGSNGFGWDAIFVPNGTSKSRGEMTMSEQEKFSTRAIAVKKLSTFLNAQAS